MWLVFSTNLKTVAEVELPIFFYNLIQGKNASTSDFVKAKVTGARKHILSEQNAVHINLDQIDSVGVYDIDVKPQNVILHPQVTLETYSPSTIKVKLIE